MSKQLLVGLTGKKFSGKSTIASYLVNNHDFVEYSLAYPLKKIIMDVFNVEHKYCFDPKYKEIPIEHLGVSARKLLQVVGTNLFRDELKQKLPELKLEGDSIWIHYLINKIKNEKKNIVISDVRFDNEYFALKNIGFNIYSVNRENNINKDTHESEKGINDFDAEILNNTTLEDLYNKVDIILNSNMKL